MKKTLVFAIIFALGLAFIAGCTQVQTPPSTNNISGQTKLSECDELAQNFDAKIELDMFQTYCKEGDIKPVQVGGTLISIQNGSYSASYDRYEYTLTFQGATKQGSIIIGSKNSSLPYQINQFYKFDLTRKCELMYSAASSGMFADPDLNALDPMNCK